MNKLSKITTALALVLGAGQAHASIIELPLLCGQFKLNRAPVAEVGVYSIIIEKAVAGDVIAFKIKVNRTGKQFHSQTQNNVELLTSIENGYDADGNYLLKDLTTGNPTSGDLVTVKKDLKSAIVTLVDGAKAICKDIK